MKDEFKDVAFYSSLILHPSSLLFVSLLCGESVGEDV
jgi:hypothetical protein